MSFARPHLGTVDKGSKQNRGGGGNSIRKMIVLLTPYWRINCKMVPLTVLKCNILNYSKNCYAKNMCGWTYAYYVGVIWRRKTCLAAGQRAEVEYTYSENIDAIAWLTYCFFFSIPARLFFFSLCSSLAPFSAHLNAWNKPVRPVITWKHMQGMQQSLFDSQAHVVQGHRFCTNMRLFDSSCRPVIYAIVFSKAHSLLLSSIVTQVVSVMHMNVWINY